MKRYLLPVVVGLLVVIVGMQSYFLYRFAHQTDRPSLASSPSLAWDDQSWDPFTEMRRMQDEMNRMFGNSFSRFNLDPAFGDLFSHSMSSPPIDLRDTGDAYEIEVDIPGAEQSAIEVEIEGNVLHIGAQTTQEQTQDRQDLLRRERFFGHFQRSLTLPGTVNPASLRTEYKNGVLSIRVNKQ